MAASQKLFRQNQWFGGYSDDEFLGIAGSFWRATGLEIRRFPRRLQLAKKLTNQAGSVINNVVRGAVVTSNFGDSIAAGANGQIYRRAAGATTWTLVYTDATNRHILDIREYNSYLYFTTRQHLHRIPIGDTGTSVAWSTVTADYKTLTNDSLDAHPLFEAFNKLYIGDGNLLAELSSAGVLTAAKLTFASDDLIRRINFKAGFIRLWCRRNVNTKDAGRCYFWNGASSAYNDMTPLDGMFQTCDERSDFFIAGHEPHLYEMVGNVANKLKKLPQLTNASSDDNNNIAADFYPNSMVSRNGIAYFAVGTYVGTIGLQWQESGVWSWGKLNSGYPDSLTLDFPFTNLQTPGTCVFLAEGKVNVAANYSSTYYLYVETLNGYQTTGEVETRVFDGQEGWMTKNSKFLGIVFAPLAAGEKIEVYVKTNLATSYGSAILTADYATVADRGLTFKVMRNPFTGQDHTHLQIKVKLTAGTSQGSTPRLYDLAELYEDIKAP